MATSSATKLRPVQTADPADTIWSAVSQDEFRQILVALEEKTNAVPVDVLTAAFCNADDKTSAESSLPLRVEKQLADDLAYISAVSEGAQSVAAVCLEQHIHKSRNFSKLVIKIAGMDVVDDNVKDMLSEIMKILQRINRADSEEEIQTELQVSSESIFHLILAQHRQKLLGRLRSRKWIKPTYLDRTHKKCLWQDFANVTHRVQHIYPKKFERTIRAATTEILGRLAEVYEQFEFTSEDETQQALSALVKATYRFCTTREIRRFAAKLEEKGGSTPQTAAVLKTLRQLEKIAAYWRVAKDLVAVAAEEKAYKMVFENVELVYVRPYASMPTDITYESWAGKCHVHAEVQLVVEEALAGSTEQGDAVTSSKSTGEASKIIRPRTIGTSKYLCYLCYLFLSYHGGYESLSTHGRLYDQWTVPDLAEYDDTTRRNFANIVEDMNRHIVRQVEETKGTVWRAEPMTSRQNLLCCETGEEEKRNELVGLGREMESLKMG